MRDSARVVQLADPVAPPRRFCAKVANLRAASSVTACGVMSGRSDADLKQRREADVGAGVQLGEEFGRPRRCRDPRPVGSGRVQAWRSPGFEQGCILGILARWPPSAACTCSCACTPRRSSSCATRSATGAARFPPGLRLLEREALSRRVVSGAPDVEHVAARVQQTCEATSRKVASRRSAIARRQYRAWPIAQFDSVR